MTVYKMVEVVGTSGKSVSDAISGAIERASATLDDLQWFEVREIRGRIQDGEVNEYQVRMDVAFKLHAPKQREGAGARAAQRTGATRATTTRATTGRATGASPRGARAQPAQAVARKGGKRTGTTPGMEKQTRRSKR